MSNAAVDIDTSEWDAEDATVGDTCAIDTVTTDKDINIALWVPELSKAWTGVTDDQIVEQCWEDEEVTAVQCRACLLSVSDCKCELSGPRRSGDAK